MNGAMENSFHSSDEHYIENRKRLLDDAVTSKTITREDRDLITSFITGKSTKIGAKRAYKYTYTLIGFRKNGFVSVPYRKMTKDNFDTAIELMNRHGYKRNTLRDYIDFLKRFALWMIDNGHIKPGDKVVREIQKLSPGRRDMMTKTVKSIFTTEEIESMIKAAPGAMWKSLICTIFDGALRPQEIGKLQWDQVTIGPQKVNINTSEKTGRPRNIPLYRASPYLKQWANQYPGERSKDAYVFLNEYNRPLSYNVMCNHIKEIAVNAGISRDRVKLHNFRHTGITDMQRRGINDSIIQKLCWGGESDMLSTYSHLDDTDADKAIAESLGIKKPDNKPKSNVLEPRLCPVCAAIAPATYTFCPDCGAPLTKDAAATKEQASFNIAEWMQNPEFRNEMIKYLQNMGK